MSCELALPNLPLPSPPRCAQTTASAFAADVTYGGANYLASGRGFAYRPSSFVMLYASYGRTHLHLGEGEGAEEAASGCGERRRLGCYPHSEDSETDYSL